MKLYYRILHKYSTEKAHTTMLLKWFYTTLNITGVGMGIIVTAAMEKKDGTKQSCLKGMKYTFCQVHESIVFIPEHWLNVTLTVQYGM
jgi:hypothetical protein